MTFGTFDTCHGNRRRLYISSSRRAYSPTLYSSSHDHSDGYHNGASSILARGTLPLGKVSTSHLYNAKLDGCCILGDSVFERAVIARKVEITDNFCFRRAVDQHVVMAPSDSLRRGFSRTKETIFTLLCCWNSVDNRVLHVHYVSCITSLDDETKQSGVAVSLLLIHLARRCRECLFVHEWRPSSKMHIAGFLLGVGHYILLPLVFVDSKRVCNNTSKSDKSTSSSKTDWMIAAIGILTCLAAQYQQYRHHVYLAELRHVTYNGVIETLPCRNSHLHFLCDCTILQ